MGAEKSCGSPQKEHRARVWTVGEKGTRAPVIPAGSREMEHAPSNYVIIPSSRWPAKSNFLTWEGRGHNGTAQPDPRSAPFKKKKIEVIGFQRLLGQTIGDPEWWLLKGGQHFTSNKEQGKQLPQSSPLPPLLLTPLPVGFQHLYLGHHFYKDSKL